MLWVKTSWPPRLSRNDFPAEGSSFSSSLTGSPGGDSFRIVDWLLSGFNKSQSDCFCLASNCRIRLSSCLAWSCSWFWAMKLVTLWRNSSSCEQPPRGLPVSRSLLGTGDSRISSGLAYSLLRVLVLSFFTDWEEGNIWSPGVDGIFLLFLPLSRPLSDSQSFMFIPVSSSNWIIGASAVISAAFFSSCWSPIASPLAKSSSKSTCLTFLFLPVIFLSFSTTTSAPATISGRTPGGRSPLCSENLDLDLDLFLTKLTMEPNRFDSTNPPVIADRNLVGVESLVLEFDRRLAGASGRIGRHSSCSGISLTAGWDSTTFFILLSVLPVSWSFIKSISSFPPSLSRESSGTTSFSSSRLISSNFRSNSSRWW